MPITSHEQLFNRPFASVDYIEQDNVVLLTWKEKCCGQDYRNATLSALSGLQNHPQSNFVVDAINGFEDEKDDVAWGFNTLLPAMAHTTCQTVVFIMANGNAIEEEMDLWTKEFMKYFKVLRVGSYAKAIAALRN